MTAAAPQPLGAIVGPTASGKSDLALGVALHLGDVEIVSIDAMQVYRGMDLGTAKPSADEAAAVRHHLIDLIDPDEEMTVARFKEAYLDALADIAARRKRALLVGGTGLYARAVIDDLEIPGRYPEVRSELDVDPDTAGLYTRLTEIDPTAAGRMEPTNRRRIVRALEVTVGSGRRFSSYGPGLATYPPLPFPLVGLRLPRPLIDERISARYARQIDAGFVDEVAGLSRRPRGMSRTAGQALGYSEVLSHLEGEVTLTAALEEAATRTRRFARRQERWFRRDPRVEWIDVAAEPIDVLPQVLAVLAPEGNRMAVVDERLRD